MWISPLFGDCEYDIMWQEYYIWMGICDQIYELHLGGGGFWQSVLTIIELQGSYWMHDYKSTWSSTIAGFNNFFAQNKDENGLVITLHCAVHKAWFELEIAGGEAGES